MEIIWYDILNKPFQGIPFKDFRAGLMNCLVDYKYKITHEDEVNTTVVSKKNIYVHIVKPNAHYISHD